MKRQEDKGFRMDTNQAEQAEFDQRENNFYGKAITAKIESRTSGQSGRRRRSTGKYLRIFMKNFI